MEINQILHKWYAENKRSLPWRRNQNPYFIWVSEIMLQQTTVSVVKPYFERFIKAFPTVETLASAPEEKVLSLWSGLGYYSRARNLQKAAKEIVQLKKFPAKYSELIKLSGIGPYTAGAIASIAFDEEVAAIDGNVIRVISRLYNIDQDVDAKETKILIARYANELVKGSVPSTHNQAMMELGATICTPKNPHCLLCPVNSSCLAFKVDTVLSRPIKKKKRGQEPWLWQLFLIKDKNEKIALVKNENGTPWLNHMWLLPGNAKPWKNQKNPKFDFKHSITHHKIFVKVRNGEKSQVDKNKNLKWVKAKDLEKLGLSSIVQKALKVAALTTLFLFLACKSTETKETTQTKPSATPIPVVKDGSPITKIGENQKGRFSKDCDKIIYQSQNRPNHKKSQIYVLNLKTNRERRITFNDGDDTSPTFDQTGTRILYASTTDEIKEHAGVAQIIKEDLVDSAKAPYDELYESQADGSHIIRLTHGVGFDGNGSYSSDGSRIVFVSMRDGQFKIYTMDRKAKKQVRLTKSQDFEYAPKFSPLGRNIIFETRPNNGQNVQIALSDIFGKKVTLLTNHEGINRDPSWSPDGTKIIYSSNRSGKYSNLYLLTTDGKCLKRLTTGSQNDLYPSFSNDGKEVIYTSDKLGTSQIYIVDFDEPKDCLGEQP